MLAQNFKTPAELGVSDTEFEALLSVLRMLERGEIKEAPPDQNWTSIFNLAECPEPTMFSMRTTQATADCGTACCIIGWARFISGDWNILAASISPKHSAYSLFFPHEMGAIHSRDPSQGAIALRNYLTFGEPRWAQAVAG